jgi:iron complex outermembrane receptor protein
MNLVRQKHLLLLLMSTASAGPAIAQDGAPAPSDIIVTAEKRAESVQKVPLTISVLSSDTMRSEGVKDLLQAAPLVPGMVFSRAPDDGLGLTFRGLGTISRSAEVEQPISLSVDGIPLAKGRLYTDAFFDVDRIEFIKSTDSSLLGKNSSLGAISIVNHQPGDTFSVESSAGYEFVDGGYQLDGALNTPLSDKAALRIAAHDNDLDGWVHNDYLNHNGPEQKDLGLRATLRLTPIEPLTITASYQYADDRQIGQSMQLVGGDLPPAYGDDKLDDHDATYTSRTDDGETQHRTRSQIASLKNELQLGDFTLISQTAYVRYNLVYDDDLDFSTDDSLTFERREHYSQVSQELRLQSPTERAFEYMAGVFYLSSHWHSLETQYWAVPDFPPPPDPASGQLFNGVFANNFFEDTRSYSGYASGRWHVVPKLTLSGGVRFSREQKDDVYGRTAIGPLTIWNTIANPPFDPTPLFHHADFVDGNVSLQYLIRPDVTAYGAFGHGSKSGGFVETNTIAVPPALLVDGKVPAALVAAGAALKDETTMSYEIGLKTELFDRRLRFNVTAFLTNITNFQDNVFTGGTLGFITFNGPARSRGVELDTSFRATRRLTVDASMTYADATAVIQPIDLATNTPEVDAAGNPVRARYRRSQAPKMIVNAGADYVRPITDRLDLRFDAQLHHRSMMYNQRQDLYPSQPLTTLDLIAGIGSHDDRWEIEVAAKNVTNAIAEDFASAPPDPRFAAFYGAHGASPNRLRTVMLTGRFHY